MFSVHPASEVALDYDSCPLWVIILSHAPASVVGLDNHHRTLEVVGLSHFPSAEETLNGEGSIAEFELESELSDLSVCREAFKKQTNYIRMKPPLETLMSTPPPPHTHPHPHTHHRSRQPRPIHTSFLAFQP